MLCFCQAAWAFDSDTAFQLAGGENETRIAALDDVISKQDVDALPFLEKLLDDEVKISATQAFVMADAQAHDPVSGAVVVLPPDADDVVNSNRMRLALQAGIATLHVLSPDRTVRLEAARALRDMDADDARQALIETALNRETDGDIRAMLLQALANIQLQSPDAQSRLKAVQTLGQSSNPNLREVLSTRLLAGNETDPQVRKAIEAAIRAIDHRLAIFDMAGRVFTGISLGSILLLAALGLAITYGLMGIINMAHGELIMIGAYTTYVVQTAFRHLSPGLFAWYLPVAVPVAFLVTAAVGMALERAVLRFLYGRTLETLLATWGISLFLIQLMRTLFGAQNVTVENPPWMSGSLTVAATLVLPYARIIIIGFSVLVLTLTWWILGRTRLGLFVRAVTQNRSMAACVGVHTGRVDTMAFGLGSGIAGLAGVALSQIGNVGPDLGQHYIIDSFMVVVLGGVGQLAGAVIAALGLGIVSKFLENITGAVLAEIIVLVFVVIFIQKRPQGLFALRGRSTD